MKIENKTLLECVLEGPPTLEVDLNSGSKVHTFKLRSVFDLEGSNLEILADSLVSVDGYCLSREEAGELCSRLPYVVGERLRDVLSRLLILQFKRSSSILGEMQQIIEGGLSFRAWTIFKTLDFKDTRDPQFKSILNDPYSSAWVLLNAVKEKRESIKFVQSCVDMVCTFINPQFMDRLRTRTEMSLEKQKEFSELFPVTSLPPAEIDPEMAALGRVVKEKVDQEEKLDNLE